MNDEYYRIAEMAPAVMESSEVSDPWKKTSVVGRGIPRIDAYERACGTAVFPSDVWFPGMLYAAVVRCPHPSARVVKVDASRAVKMPGVHAVITGKTKEADLPWYPSRSGPPSRLFDPVCRFEGEEVAAVAAETPHQAWDAARAVAVEYQVLPFVADDRDALEAGAPAVHDGGNLTGDPEVYRRGDVEKGFAEADVTVERTYRTDCQIHTPTEPHGCVARWEGSRLTAWDSTQGVFGGQELLARVFGLPLSGVRVIGKYVGGGFGSKLSPGKYAPIAAILARKTGRPVKLFLTREETFLCMGNRPANSMRMKVGARKDGTLTAMEFVGSGSGGAYNPSGTVILDWQVRDLYRCANVRTEGTSVYINAGDQRPMRAPGHPQCSWALEQILDELAGELGMDPVELRLRNLTDVSQARGDVPYTSTGFGECLAEGAKEFGWEEARRAERGDDPVVRGVGMAGCLWIAGAGGPPSTAIVKYFADGSAVLNMGASDIGTGTKTVMAMVVAEELGTPVDRIRIEHADTGTTQYASASGGSKTVPTEAPTVRAAALECRQRILEMAAGELEVPSGELDLKDGEVFSTEDPDRRIAVGRIGEFRRVRVVMGTGHRGPNPGGRVTCPFAAQFCEVEVNRRTGEVRVVRFVAAHDSGRVMNRMTYDNQVYGGIAMGIGFGMMERRVLDRGRTGKMVNAEWGDYKIPTALDVPVDIVPVAVDPEDEECNATGAKGLGEPVTIPTAAAIANAVYHATGIRVTETPINPTRMLELLAAGKKERRG
jgi:xanthine dehydrogenase YagR molybdenum-binding subunit